jgi:glycosyltransferase involved in cell wall biosynthesis
VNPSSPATTPLLSVVIASHRPGYLRDLLLSLARQSMDRSAGEIIAVCDYEVEPLIKEFPGIDFFFINDCSISKKRNVGVARAAGPIVAFIDDDCLPATDWLERGYGYLSAHPEAAAVEGLTNIESHKNAPPALREYRRLQNPGFRTNNLFCRKANILQAGGFDERFTVQREDLDLCFAMLDKGQAIHHCADITVTHRIRSDEPWDLLKNCVNRRFDPLLYKKHPKRYREMVRSPFPPSLLLLLALHLITATSALFLPPVLIICLAADVCAVSAITLRRCGLRVPLTIFMTEWISCLLAPFVLAGALIHGSIRFGRFLFI